MHNYLSSLLAVEEERYGHVFLLLSMTAHVSLFPLLHQPAGTYVHACVTLMVERERESERAREGKR